MTRIPQAAVERLLRENLALRRERAQPDDYGWVGARPVLTGLSFP